MTFPREPAVSKSPSSVDHITVVLQTGSGGEESIKGFFEVVFTDGSIKTIQFPLAGYLTSQQITQLRAFMDSIRIRANQEIL